MVERRILRKHDAVFGITPGVGVEADAAQLAAIVRGVVLGALLTDGQAVGLRTVGRVVIVQESRARVAIDTVKCQILPHKTYLVARFGDRALDIHVMANPMSDVHLLNPFWIFQTQSDSWRWSWRR